MGVDKELQDPELVRLLAEEKAKADGVVQAQAVQAAAEVSAAVADAAANPVHAIVPEGVEPFTRFTVIPHAVSTDRTQFAHSNTLCDQCEEGETDVRRFERCERCNIVYHRTCLEPQPQFPLHAYIFLCDYPECTEQWNALQA